MSLNRATTVALLLAATGLILLSFSLSLPVYHTTGGQLYANQTNPGLDDEDLTARLLSILGNSLIAGIIFGWLFIAACVINARVSSVILGWLSIVLSLVSVAYFLSKMGDLNADGGISSGVIVAVIGTLVTTASVYIRMNDVLQKPATEEPDEGQAPAVHEDIDGLVR